MIGNIINQAASGSSGGEGSIDLMSGYFSFQSSTGSTSQYGYETLYFEEASSTISFADKSYIKYVRIQVVENDYININLVSNSINYLNTEYNFESYFHINYSSSSGINLYLAIFYRNNKNELTAKMNGSYRKFGTGFAVVNLNYWAVVQ